jgi:hypothetical protein
MDNRFTQRTLLADGTLNPSQPRADGKPGSAFYGTLHINLAHPAVIAALAEGRDSVALDLSVYARTRKADGAKFFGVTSYRTYEPAAEEGAAENG